MSSVSAIDYQQEPSLAAEELGPLFASSGIKRPADDIERLAKMIEHANLIVTARSEGHLVGVARCMTDFSWVCLLADLAVHRDHQKQGIGKQLVDEVSRIVGDSVSISLFAAPEAEPYYPKIGFQKVAGFCKRRTS